MNPEARSPHVALQNASNSFTPQVKVFLATEIEVRLSSQVTPEIIGEAHLFVRTNLQEKEGKEHRTTQPVQRTAEATVLGY